MKAIFICLAFLVSFNSVNAQKYLLIETINDPQTIKIVSGETIAYKIYASDEWLTGKISKIMINENSLLFEDALVSLNQISHIRRYRPIARYIGGGLMTFGAGWFVFGGLGAASGSYDVGADTFVIGGTALVTGWLINKLFYKRTLQIGDRYRLRLIDLSLN